jgi:hypothetical protein
LNFSLAHDLLLCEYICQFSSTAMTASTDDASNHQVNIQWGKIKDCLSRVTNHSDLSIEACMERYQYLQSLVSNAFTQYITPELVMNYMRKQNILGLERIKNEMDKFIEMMEQDLRMDDEKNVLISPELEAAFLEQIKIQEPIQSIAQVEKMKSEASLSIASLLEGNIEDDEKDGEWNKDEQEESEEIEEDEEDGDLELASEEHPSVPSIEEKKDKLLIEKIEEEILTESPAAEVSAQVLKEEYQDTEMKPENIRKEYQDLVAKIDTSQMDKVMNIEHKEHISANNGISIEREKAIQNIFEEAKWEIVTSIEKTGASISGGEVASEELKQPSESISTEYDKTGTAIISRKEIIDSKVSKTRKRTISSKSPIEENQESPVTPPKSKRAKVEISLSDETDKKTQRLIKMLESGKDRRTTRSLTKGEEPTKEKISNEEEEISKEVQKKIDDIMLQVIRTLMKEADAEPFKKPVTEAIAPGYEKIIKQKRDFSWLQRNIKNKNIRTVTQLWRNIALMFQNAMLFNPRVYEIHTQAKELRQKARKLIREALVKEANLLKKDLPPIYNMLSDAG